MRWTTKNLMNRVWDLGVSPLGKTGKTLKLLGSGVVDQRQTALLEQPPFDLARLVLQTVDFLYRVEGGLGGTEDGLAPGAVSEESGVGDASDPAGRRVAHYHPPGGQKS